jgi:hypothetical protein
MGAADGGGERDGETGDGEIAGREAEKRLLSMFSLGFSLRRTVLPREQPAGMK